MVGGWAQSSHLATQRGRRAGDHDRSGMGALSSANVAAFVLTAAGLTGSEMAEASVRALPKMRVDRGQDSNDSLRP